ncbi:MAG: DNA repair protein RecO [Rhizobiaceae bacterium]|jgi:DNA repair protein RecO (recombination protein O)|nr:DNA repair protein RecO [Rhizobiaceae bacterium]
MHWSDDGIILGCRRHGETSVIVEALTRGHGRVLGLVRGGRSRTMQPTLQPGNRVALTWRARLEEHLGQFVIEPTAMRAARLMDSPAGLHGIQLVAAHLRLLPEREAVDGVFDAVDSMIEHLPDAEDAGELVARFEIALLEELGFGLDLKRCAMTGAAEGLAYVSPKTGRAVTREAGAPWAGKLLALPPFLRAGANERADAEGLALAFALTGHFLLRNVYEPRGLDAPPAREAFIRACTVAALRPQPDVEPALP